MLTARPRLLVLTSTYPRWAGDPEPGFVHELSRRLARDFDLHVLCPHAPGTPPRTILDGVCVHRFRYAPVALETLVQGGGVLNNLKHHLWKWLLVPPFLMSLAWNTGRLIRQLRPDCIHAHWIIPQGLALMLTRPFIGYAPPFLLTSHGGDLFGLRGALLSGLKTRVLRQADAVSVVSRPMVRVALELGVSPDRLFVAPMGVDFGGLFTPGSLEDRRPVEILFVGRLVEKKGLKYLLRAMPDILTRFPDLRLTIAGYGPEENTLRELATHLGVVGNVDFLGAMPQAELPALYRRASVFVAPFVHAASGDQEGLPVALMEAIACECPVVAGDLEVLEDIFEPEEMDMRIDAKDAHRLAARIIFVLDHPEEAGRRVMGMRKRLESRLGWDSISHQYKEMLWALLETRGRKGNI